MATVKFSGELRDAILKNARNVFDKQYDALDDRRPAHTWGDFIYDTLYGQYQPTINALPAMFFTTVDHIRVDRFGTMNVAFEFRLSNPRVHPIGIPDTEYAKHAGGYYTSNYILKDHPAWEPLFAEVLEWRTTKEKLDQKRTDFVRQVGEVINAYETLAPALKVWPPLWELVPEKYKERHREVVTRTKKEVVISADLNTLTAITTAHKLGA